MLLDIFFSGESREPIGIDRLPKFRLAKNSKLKTSQNSPSPVKNKLAVADKTPVANQTQKNGVTTKLVSEKIDF